MDMSNFESGSRENVETPLKLENMKPKSNAFAMGESVIV